MALSLEGNELYVPESAAEIRDQMLRDMRLESRKYSAVEPAVHPGSDDYLFFASVGNALYLQAGNAALSRSALNPEDAVGEDLENWRRALKLPVVEPAPSAGAITVETTGSASLADGTEFVLPNGLRGKVSGNHVGIASGQDVAVVTIDTGEDTRFPAGTVVRFVSPPTNVRAEAKVSVNAPLTGGADAEDDERKRERIINRLANSPGSGSWGQLREYAFNALATVQNCWVYPALGGPSSEKIVIAKAFDPANRDFSREFGSAATNIVRGAIHTAGSGSVEHVVESVADEQTSVVLKIKIPNSIYQGGDGRGWLDGLVWPASDASGNVNITATTSSTSITVDYSGSTAPINGQTRIAWWAPGDMKFYVRTVVSHSGSAGAWVLNLDAPLVDSQGTAAAIGDYISPGAVNLERYAETWVAFMGTLAAGENTSDVNRLPRSLRHPLATDDKPEEITAFVVAEAFKKHSEITNLTIHAITKSAPTVPASVADPPNVLVPQHFGLLPL